MGAQFHFHGTVTNVAESITNNIVNNYYGTSHEAADRHLPDCEYLEYLECGPGTEPAAAASKGRTGRIAEPLFVGKGGARDEALTKRMADEFLGILQEEGIAGMEIDTKRSNGVNMAFAKCYAGWQKQHLVPSLPNGSACYRFLAEDCALCIKGAPKAYAEFIRKEIARRRC